MGYNLAIGEGYLAYDKSDNYLRVEVRSEHLDNAPAFGEPTDYTNQRWPSYTAWADFLRFTNLYEIILDKDNDLCLMPSHPGFAAISEEHKAVIDEAYEAFYIKYPNCKAGYSPKQTDFVEDPEWPRENTYAVRLEWLKFWIDWSLENCEIPTFYNS